MSQLGEIMSLGLQARIDLEGGARTIVELLRTERMDGADRAAERRPSLKARLGLKALACCGATWGLVLGLGSTAVTATGEDEEVETGGPRISTENRPVQPWAATGMNLAAALAAERQLRAEQDSETAAAESVPLMRLLEQTEEEAGPGWVCCVCMVRNKGAAFIPCGHTFCRVCSRELCLGRAACPLCNRPILQTLDIY